MDKKQAILDTTLDLVTDRGLYDTPMAEVAGRAGVAAGTIYHYFKNKEHLIISLYENLRMQVSEVTHESNDPSATFQRQFVQLWKTLYQFFVDHPKIFKFIQQFENSPFRQKISAEEDRSFDQSFLSFLQTGIDERILKPIPVELMLSILQGSVASVANSSISGRIEIDNPKLIKAIQVSWDGLKIKTMIGE